MPNLDRREFLIASGASTCLVTLPRHVPQPQPARVRVVGLKVDHIDRPLGLENVHPRLSWRLESNERSVQQSAYRILVSSSRERLKRGRADLWDSGKVVSR